MRREGAKALKLTVERLADSGITSNMLSKWKNEKSGVSPYHFAALARAFDVDPLEPFIEQGLLPKVYSSRAQVETLLRLSNAQAELAAMQAGDADERHRTALSQLMDAVVARPPWAVRVEAVVTGHDPQIHLSTRLVFTQANRSGTEHNDVLAVPDFSRLLLALDASKSDPRLAGAPGAFSAPRYTRPRAPSAQTIDSCRSIVVLGTTVRSWAPVFAARVARRLHYGLTSSQDLAAGAANVSIDLCSAAQIGVQAWNLIRSAPERYVSYHYEQANLDGSQTLEALGTLPEHVRIIWLEEDEQLLRHAARNRTHGEIKDEPERLKEYSRDVQQALSRYSDQVLTVPVRLPKGTSYLDDPHKLRPRRVSDALHATDEAFVKMTELGWITDDNVEKARIVS